MEAGGTSLIQKSSDSSLTESWNVVDAQEVSNASEGSDGESIEVIDEEVHHRDSTPETGSDSTVTSSCSPSDSNILEDNFIDHPFSDDTSDQTENEDIVVLGSTHHAPPCSETPGGNNLYCACFFIGLILSVLLSGAVFSLFLLKVEEFASDQFKYLASYYTSDNSANDYQELLDQIKIYKEESQDLKGIVADLNAAVQNLKNELASKTSGSMPHDVSKQDVNEEDPLFRQLLNIHTGNFQISNDSEYIPEEYENSFTVIENMLKRLTEDEEREKNMETIKLFYLIPKHLSVLGAHYLTNDNIRQFIDDWKSKLSIVNENLIKDMKEMQLKMIRHTVKHLKHMEKCFFKKLCDLKNFNKQECYEAFIKPYESTDVSLDDVKLEDSFCSEGQKKKSKNGKGSDSERNQSCTPKSNRNLNKKISKIQEPNNYQFKKYVESKQPNNVNIDDKMVEKDTRDSPMEIKIDHNKQKVKEKPQPSLQRKIKKVVEKGMDSDIVHSEGLEKSINKDATNSFSSFSGADCPRKGLCRKRKDQEGWWFLKLGQHRSEVREAKSKGDWFFERAWRRKNARNRVLFNKPFKSEDFHLPKKNRYDRLFRSFVSLRHLFFL